MEVLVLGYLSAHNPTSDQIKLTIPSLVDIYQTLYIQSSHKACTQLVFLHQNVRTEGKIDLVLDLLFTE
jgi:hypothetical protein